MKKLTVNLKKRTDDSYEIFFGTDVLRKLIVDLKSNGWGKKYAIITDSKVKKLYGDKLLKQLKKAEIDCALFSFPQGEKNKNLAQAEKLLHKFSSENFHRDDAVIALGGGVVGDLASFVASIYMRGIPYIQIPTTLLSMVDSSVGGKTGVDTKWGKNLVGSFHQPKAVYINPNYLKTLPPKQVRNGIAETIKYGVIGAPSLITILRKKKELIEKFDSRVLEKIIMKCVKIKSRIVSSDEKERGLRKILNYGHTIGHAIEKLSKFTIEHGQGVSLGMSIVNTIAVDKKVFAKKNSELIKNLLKLYELPTKFLKPIDSLKIIEALKHDKKVEKGKIVFVVPQKIGKVVLSDKITNRDIIKACKKHL